MMSVGGTTMLKTATVREWMTSPALTVSPSWSVRSAYDLMNELGIRHLPVVTQGELVGILTLSDIREAQPSDATTLSAWELNYLWEKLTVERVMTTPVVTVRADDRVVDAIQIMLDRKFSGLPVIGTDGALEGFLSQIDIYRLLVATERAEIEPAHT
jgi:acetoin utilization protein AcuB